MCKNNNLSEKVLVLGVDGMDPRLSKKFMDQGLMPNLKKFVDLGACREDLVMLGNMPTITPPMWTTLATGATAATHGITCFWGHDHDDLGLMVYNLDSRRCKAEQIWNIFAEEAKKKTLIWHWPGSSWPPTSTSPNLHVVDGTQPSSVSFGFANKDTDKIILADIDIDNLGLNKQEKKDTGAGCVISNLEQSENEQGKGGWDVTAKTLDNLVIELTDGESAAELSSMDMVESPIKTASGWDFEIPDNSKEFIILHSGGFARRIGLITCDEKGIYNKVIIYRNKNNSKPIVVLDDLEMKFNILDDCTVEGKNILCTRNYRLLEISPDGNRVRLWMGHAMDIENDAMFYPKELYKEVRDNVGYVPVFAGTEGYNDWVAEKIILPSWDYYSQWQAKALNYLIEENGHEVVFSHLHNIDAMGHGFWAYAREGNHEGTDTKKFQHLIQQAYVDTDKYLGQFLHLLEKDWSIFIVSDHGLLVRNEEMIPILGDPFGINITIMEQLGYTVLQKNEDGVKIKKIDWDKTKAVASQGNQIWINLKGRNASGIVEPSEKYDLEEQIINDLYSYRLPNGKRAVAVALRNKDAAVIGMNGEECGDIIYFLNEGGNRVHGDSMSTYLGAFDSSVSPIFVAAGKGIKKGVKTERVIRQIDFAPTIAEICGIRKPAQCEGAPVYQIISK